MFNICTPLNLIIMSTGTNRDKMARNLICHLITAIAIELEEMKVLMIWVRNLSGGALSIMME